MLHEPASPQDIVNIGWPGHLVFPPLKSYHVNPGDSPQLRICWVFIGPDLDATRYNILMGFMSGFRKDVFDGLVLTVFRGSMWLERIRQWTHYQGFSYFEFRSLDPARGFEGATREYSGVHRNVTIVSSFLSIPFDSLASLTLTVCARNLANLDVVHVHSPRKLLNEATAIAAGRGLGAVLSPAEVRKCVLPLDLIGYLDDALDILARGIGLEELELSSPDTVMPQDHDISLHLGFGVVSGGYGSYNAMPSPRFLDYLSCFTSLKTLTIPISIITPEFIQTVSCLPELIKLKATPIRTIISVRHFLISMQGANIGQRGPGRFESLGELDLDSASQVLATATLGGWDCYHQLENIFPGTQIT